jgi:hypothetical protein
MPIENRFTLLVFQSSVPRCAKIEPAFLPFFDLNDSCVVYRDHDLPIGDVTDTAHDFRYDMRLEFTGFAIHVRVFLCLEIGVRILKMQEKPIIKLFRLNINKNPEIQISITSNNGSASC